MTCEEAISDVLGEPQLETLQDILDIFYIKIFERSTGLKIASLTTHQQMKPVYWDRLTRQRPQKSCWRLRRSLKRPAMETTFALSEMWRDFDNAQQSNRSYDYLSTGDDQGSYCNCYSVKSQIGRSSRHDHEIMKKESQPRCSQRLASGY